MSNFQKIAEDPVEAVKNIIGVGQKIYENNEPTGSTYADRFLINSLITGGLGAATGAITAGLDDEENEEVRRRKMISNTILGGLLGGTVGAGYSAATKLHSQDSAKDRIKKEITDGQNDKTPPSTLVEKVNHAIATAIDDNKHVALVAPTAGVYFGGRAGSAATQLLQKAVLHDPTQVAASVKLLNRLPAGAFSLTNTLHAEALDRITSNLSGLSKQEIQKVLSAITSTAPYDAPNAIFGQQGVVPSFLGAAGQKQQELAVTKWLRELFRNSNNRPAQDFDLWKNHVTGTPLPKPLTLNERMFGPGRLSGAGPSMQMWNPNTGLWTSIPSPRIPLPNVPLNAAAFAEMGFVPYINRVGGLLRNATAQRVAGTGAGVVGGVAAGLGVNSWFHTAAEKARKRVEATADLSGI
jgi:hypothetical protein